MSAPTYRAWTDPFKPPDPAGTVRIAIDEFVWEFGTLPGRVHCHPDDAGVLTEALGLAVVADGRARRMYLVGPLPQEVSS